MFNFYCVTLENNIETIEKCILKLKKIYKNKFSYTIITPKKSLKAFSEIESKYNCKIIDENQIISKSDFRYLVYSIKERIIKEENKKITIDESRIYWYYQQILKLSYLIENSKFKSITMIDADTIILKKINFFSKNKSNVFYTPFEKHRPYLDTLNTIFNYNVDFKSWVSNTCQINSLTKKESMALSEKLDEYLKKDKDESTAVWLSKIIIDAIFKTHNSMQDSLISEQDFIGFFLTYHFKKVPKKILFLRNGIEYKLTKKQELLASIIGFKHLTYESWNIKDGFYSWINFLNMVKINIKVSFSKIKN